MVKKKGIAGRRWFEVLYDSANEAEKLTGWLPGSVTVR